MRKSKKLSDYSFYSVGTYPKQTELCWNVIDSDLSVRNLFDYNWCFNKSLYKVKKKYGASRGKNCQIDKFCEEVKSTLMYYFWSRSEYEIILSGWIKKVDEYKLDVYTQVVLNWDRFIEYLWNNRRLIKNEID